MKVYVLLSNGVFRAVYGSLDEAVYDTGVHADDVLEGEHDKDPRGYRCWVGGPYRIEEHEVQE